MKGAAFNLNNSTGEGATASSPSSFTECKAAKHIWFGDFGSMRPLDTYKDPRNMMRTMTLSPDLDPVFVHGLMIRQRDYQKIKGLVLSYFKETRPCKVCINRPDRCICTAFLDGKVEFEDQGQLDLLAAPAVSKKAPAETFREATDFETECLKRGYIDFEYIEHLRDDICDKNLPLDKVFDVADYLRKRAVAS